VPTDFSAHADEAFRVAHALARMIGADVILFHIAQPPAVVLEGGRFLAESAKGEAANLWNRFQHIPPEDTKVRVEHEIIVAERPSAKEILDMLDRQGCDLIVMGTHGTSWLKQRLFGSLTEEVVRRARCPVMVVKPPTRAQDPPALEPAQAPGRRGTPQGNAPQKLQ
jgi:nucleotide-binding universal stress UspA family protein